MSVKVGSFTKITATTTQSVTGVGFKPKALILWTAGSTSDATWHNGYNMSIGFSADYFDTLTSGSISVASEHNVATSNSSSRITAKALTIVDPGEVLVAECDLDSMDSDGFTLDWTYNTATSSIVQYMALGGDGMIAAEVINWTASGSTGETQTISSTFPPDCLLHLATAQEGTGSSASANLMFSGSENSASDGLVTGFRANDGQFTSNTWKLFEDYAIAPIYSNGGLYCAGDFDGTNYDNFGFDIYYSYNSYDPIIFSLALWGGEYSVGYFSKSTSTGNDSITGVGFQPEGVLFANVGGSAFTFTTDDHSYYGFGATDGTNEKATWIYDEDNVSTTNAGAISKSDKSIVIAPNNSRTIASEADIVSLDSDGFTINWSSNDGDADLVFYFAFKANDTAYDPDTLLGGEVLIVEREVDTDTHLGGAALIAEREVDTDTYLGGMVLIVERDQYLPGQIAGQALIVEGLPEADAQIAGQALIVEGLPEADAQVAGQALIVEASTDFNETQLAATAVIAEAIKEGETQLAATAVIAEAVKEGDTQLAATAVIAEAVKEGEIELATVALIVERVIYDPVYIYTIQGVAIVSGISQLRIGSLQGVLISELAIPETLTYVSEIYVTHETGTTDITSIDISEIYVTHEYNYDGSAQVAEVHLGLEHSIQGSVQIAEIYVTHEYSIQTSAQVAEIFVTHEYNIQDSIQVAEIYVYYEYIVPEGEPAHRMRHGKAYIEGTPYPYGSIGH